ncbi:MAG: hypothetical protein KTR25_01465 [Myxococcales bacterium]|nr:hypothetical protein [Myxococcales bacterium]
MGGHCREIFDQLRLSSVAYTKYTPVSLKSSAKSLARTIPTDDLCPEILRTASPLIGWLRPVYALFVEIFHETRTSNYAHWTSHSAASALSRVSLQAIPHAPSLRHAALA